MKPKHRTDRPTPRWIARPLAGGFQSRAGWSRWTVVDLWSASDPIGREVFTSAAQAAEVCAERNAASDAAEAKLTTGEKIRRRISGRTLSEEHKAKIAAAHKARLERLAAEKIPGKA